MKMKLVIVRLAVSIIRLIQILAPYLAVEQVKYPKWQ